MSLFKLENRKQLAVDTNGESLTVYAPSALHRCEYLHQMSESIANNPELPEIGEDETTKQQLLSISVQHQWGKSERKYQCFLVAACLLPGLKQQSFEQVLAEVEQQPDDVLKPLVEASQQVADLITEVKD